MKFLVLTLFLFLSTCSVLAQYNSGGTQFYIGPRASINAARYTAAKNLTDLPSANENRLGFSGGLMYKFRVNELISLHGELNYERRTRSVIDSAITTEMQNFHLDAPILFEINFPAKTERFGKFEYFFNIGAQISYWLQGSGKTTIPENSQKSILEYNIDFDQINSIGNDDKGLNRYQYGFIVGGGVTLPSIGDNFFVLEARYNFCQTYLGYDYNVSNENLSYEDDLRGNYQVVSLSLAYTFGLNFAPNSKKSSTKVKTVVK